MLLSGYHIQMTRSDCNHTSQAVICVADLDSDVGGALPYLNAKLGGLEYIKDPPSVTFKTQGKMIAVHSRKIFINGIRDEDEAGRVMQWLQQEINQVWDDRDSIQPRFEGKPKPRMMDILRLLPKTNCRECGAPTCMVFALRLIEGGPAPTDCAALDEVSLKAIGDYLDGFSEGN